MSTILVIVIIIVFLGGGGSYYGFHRYGSASGFGILGLVLLILLIVWLLRGLRT